MVEEFGKPHVSIWIRVLLAVIGAIIVALGLLLAWSMGSVVSDGVIRSSRHRMAPLELSQDPVAFWVYVSIWAIFSAIAVAGGCRMVLESIRLRSRRMR